MIIVASALITLTLLGLALALIAHSLGQEKERILSALAGKGARRPVAPVLVLHRAANDDSPGSSGRLAEARPLDLGFAA